MHKLRVGLDNYCLFPRNMMPDVIVKWASANGARGMTFSGFNDVSRKKLTTTYLQEVNIMAKDLDLYLEWGKEQNVPMDLSTFSKNEINSSNRKAIEEANARKIQI
jgi:hypothetical protein